MKTNPTGGSSGGGGGGSVNSVDAVAPLSSTGGTDPDISIVGLTDFGNPGQYLVTDPTGSACEWKDLPTPTGVTSVSATTPLASSGGSTPVVSLTGLTTLGTVGQVMAVNAGATGLEWVANSGGGTVTNVTGTEPIVSSGGATPAISLHGLTGLGTAGQLPMMNGGATALVWGTPSGVFLPAVVLSGGAGTYSIIHDNCNRPVSIADTGPQINFVFPNIATDPTLVDGDYLTVDNYGPGIILMTGVILSRAGFKRFVLPGETCQATYRAATDTWITNTPVILLKSIRAPNFQTSPQTNSTTVTQFGVGAPSVLDTSAVAAVASAATAHGQITKNQYATAAAAVDRTAGVALGTALTLSPFRVPTAATAWEWNWRGGAGLNDTTTDGRFFLGFAPVQSVFNVEPSTLLNSFGLYSDSTMSQLKLGYNDGSGSFTPVTLNGGSGFPSQNNSAADFYELYTWWRADGSTAYVFWQATNLVTGVFDWGVLDCGGSNMPAAGTQMLAQGWRNSGPATAATARFQWGGFFAGASA